MLNVFIGWDKREVAAYDACVKSIVKRTKIPIQIIPIKIDPLRESGLYIREYYIDDNHIRRDAIDNKPFSTDFSFSRFLVPFLSHYRGWSMFVDCDFIFTAPLDELFEERDESMAVHVVKQVQEVKDLYKMDGCLQVSYQRKNWSSLMLFNCSHEQSQNLTPHIVNNETGSYLHRFHWCDDNLIGDLSEDWNFLATPKRELPDKTPRGIHYTEGGPWFDGYKDVPYAELWVQEAIGSSDEQN